ncbi:glycoside hydrolase family 31 protein [Blautia sp. RD014234]|nr:glycoside hydrolase family 31 protein [Blautia parvula]
MGFQPGKIPSCGGNAEDTSQQRLFVMLWICPYITPDTLQYRQAKAMDILIKNPDGKPLITEWWNGWSAALDLSNPAAVNWLDEQLQALRAMGVDGFKFDGADVLYYPDDMVTAGGVTPNEMARLWCAYAEKFPFNELRMAFKAGGMSLMQRLCDKPHNWGEEGIRALLPDTLMQGITGHPFGSPDMIGGGEYVNFQENSGNLDQELFNRHSEIACLLPVMQFSAAPWRVLGRESYDRILKSVKLRERYAARILELAHHAARTGEPIARYMAYEFPEGGYERVNDQFMLGEDILVAPICEKGRTSRNVAVPKGKWRFRGTAIESEGTLMELAPEDGEPIVLEKCE